MDPLSLPGRVGFLAFGLFLLVVGLGVLLIPGGSLATTLAWTGGVVLAMGLVLVILHVAVGPRRSHGGRRA